MSAEQPVVLIVDDDQDIRETLKDVLAEAGFAPACAADGNEAIRWLRANPLPAVILLDWMMPRCDGATFRALQLSDPAIARVPVVLLTADVMLSEAQREALGQVTYLKKPVKLATLLDVLAQHCPAPA